MSSLHWRRPSNASAAPIGGEFNVARSALFHFSNKFQSSPVIFTLRGGDSGNVAPTAPPPPSLARTWTRPAAASPLEQGPQEQQRSLLEQQTPAIAVARRPALPVSRLAASSPQLPPPRRASTGVLLRTVPAAPAHARNSTTKYTRANYLISLGAATKPEPAKTPVVISQTITAAAAPRALNDPSSAAAHEPPRAAQAAGTSSKFVPRSRRVFISPRILHSTTWPRLASIAISAAPAPAPTAQASSPSSSIAPKVAEPHRSNSSFRFASKKPAPISLKWRRAVGGTAKSAPAAASARPKSAPSNAPCQPPAAQSSLLSATRDMSMPASLSFDRRAQIPCPQWQRRGECPIHSLWLKHRPATTTTASIAAHASSMRSNHGSFASKSSLPPPCPFLHDPMQVPICRAFVRGKCRRENCPLSHRVRAHQGFAHYALLPTALLK